MTCSGQRLSWCGKKKPLTLGLNSQCKTSCSCSWPDMRPPGYDNINSSTEDQYLSCSENPGNFGRFDTEAGICSLCGKIPRAHMQRVRKRLPGFKGSSCFGNGSEVHKGTIVKVVTAKFIQASFLFFIFIGAVVGPSNWIPYVIIQMKHS